MAGSPQTQAIAGRAQPIALPPPAGPLLQRAPLASAPPVPPVGTPAAVEHTVAAPESRPLPTPLDPHPVIEVALTPRMPEHVSITAHGPDRAAPSAVEERPPSRLTSIREVPAADEHSVTDLARRPVVVLEQVVARGEAAEPRAVEQSPEPRVAILEPAPKAVLGALAVQPATVPASLPRVHVRIGAIEIHPTGSADTAPAPAAPAAAPTTAQAQAGFDDFVALRTYAHSGW